MRGGVCEQRIKSFWKKLSWLFNLNLKTELVVYFIFSLSANILFAEIGRNLRTKYKLPIKDKEIKSKKS